MKNKFLNRTKYLRHALLMSILFFGSIYVNAQKITNFSPKSAIGGTSVILTGSGFNSDLSKNVVSLEGVWCAVTSATTTSLTITVPSGGTTGKFQYTNLTTGKVCLSGHIFVMAYNAVDKFTNNSFNCTDFSISGVADYKLVDFDKNGKTDIVLATGTTLQTVKNNTTNSEVQAADFTSTTLASYTNNEPGYNPVFLYGYDLRGTGNFDFAMLANGQTTNNRFIKNAGDTNYSSSNFEVSNPFARTETRGDFIDIDADGKLDFASVYALDGWDRNILANLFQNTSNASTFSFVQDVNYGLKYNTNTFGVGFIKSADFDNDGDIDVLITTRYKNSTYTAPNTVRVIIFRNNGSTTFSRDNFTAVELGSITLGEAVYDVQLADFNSDGKVDIVLGLGTSGRIQFRTNTSTGADNIQFTTSNYFYSSGRENNGIAIADVNNDGKPDLFVTANNNTKGTMFFLNNSTSNTISFDNEIFLSKINGGYLKVVDLNNDGTPELLINANSAVQNYWNGVQSDLRVLKFNANKPVFTINANLSTFYKCSTGNSPVQSFTVEGTNITAAVTIPNTAGFEYSTNNINFSVSLNLNPVNNAIPLTTIYIRVRNFNIFNSYSYTSNQPTSTTCGFYADPIWLERDYVVAQAITIQPTVSNATICKNTTPQTVSVTATNEIGYQWYVNTSNSVSGATIINSATSASFTLPNNITGTKYYFVKVLSDGCATLNSQIVSQTIVDPVGSINAIYGTTSLATSATTATYFVTPMSGATSYVWELPAGMTLSSQTGPTVTVNLSTSYVDGKISVKAISPCNETPKKTLYVKRLENNAFSITGEVVLCPNSNQVYTVPSVTGGNYVWTVPSTVVIVSGQGTSSITVSASQGFTAGELKVTCSTATDSQQALLNIASAPFPSSITGPFTLCGLTQATYSVKPINGVSFQWSVPSGITITSGADTNSILVSIDGSVSGILSVRSVSNCGISAPVKMSVNSNPVLMNITGAAVVCGSIETAINTNGQITANNPLNQYTYSIPTVSGVSIYTWSVPTGATLVSGQGTSSIVISYDLVNFESGIISVQAINSCGAGLPRNFAVSTIIGKITGPTSLCAMTSATYAVPSDMGTNFVWSLPQGMSITSGSGTPSITVSINNPVNFATSNQVSVSFNTPCGGTRSLALKVNCLDYTSLKSTQCGASVDYDARIYPISVTGAEQYAFDIYEVDGTTLITTIESTTGYFNFSQINFTFGTTYIVKVRVKIGGVYGVAGSACNVTVSNVIQTTKVYPVFCGTTLANLDTKIGANPVFGATGYRFEIISGATTIVYDSPIYLFRLTDTGVATYSTTYSIRVAAKRNGIYGNYGASCNVTTPTLAVNAIPTTAIMPSYCSTTLATLATKIPASMVPAATGYRFEITANGATTVYNSTAYIFRLTDAGVAAYGTIYSIRVAALFNGVYGNYGAFCNVTTPILSAETVPTTAILPAVCGTTLAALDTKIGAVVVAGATAYRFEITTGGVTTIYDSNVYNFKLSQTGVAVAYGITYAIRVATLVNGVWGNYGASCAVTTPGLFAPTRLIAKSFEVSAYPNPFETAFNLNLETPSKENVTIAVYDMMGKLVETHQINPMEVANLQIGNNFAAGIYNVIVSQANEMQAIRLIRK